MFARQYVQTALQLVQRYQGDLPFVHFLKEYFKANKKHGSRDRKQIAQLCYTWFRLGSALKHLPSDDRMAAAVYLCSEAPNPLLNTLLPGFEDTVNVSLEEKLQHLALPVSTAGLARNIFPWLPHLSAGLDGEIFALSHLVQPDLFIRARPGYEKLISKKLQQSGIEVVQHGEDTFQLPNGFSVDSIGELNKELVVQDLNSQRTLDLLDAVLPELKMLDECRVWDACAASGGKSIGLFDRLPGVVLTVSDIRSSILQNLHQRFRQAGVYNYDGFVADLSIDPVVGERYEQLPLQDLIIADLPCSGSGTWSRTPEHLPFFKEQEIERYSKLQRSILRSVVSKLAPGKYLLYITCSVFAQENEENLAWLSEKYGLACLQQQVLPGYLEKADCMFAALLQNNL